ncbi:MAG: DUF4422 domain-containing protein [Clostridia bacterium]|nr:DUF4422 domain-containing protein [Clostridia bacterium]
MKKEIFVLTIKPFECPEDPMYVPMVAGAAVFDTKYPENYVLDNTGDNISEKNRPYSEFTATYWIWKNAQCDTVGINHYRRYFIRGGWMAYFLSLASGKFFQKKRLRGIDVDRIFSKGINCILPKKQFRLFHTMQEEFEIYHSKTLLEDTEAIIRETQPQYLKTYRQVMDGYENYLKCNCILPKYLYDKYCEWMFGIFSELEKKGYGKTFREFAFLGERLMNVWFEFHKSVGVIKAKELFYVNTDYRLKNILKNDTEVILPKCMKGPLKLYRKILKKAKGIE